MSIDDETRLRLLEKARLNRKTILRMVLESGSGHLGGNLSQTDLLVALYYRTLRFDVSQPDAPDRDRFVLSKAHGGLGQAAIFADLGLIETDELREFGRTGARLGINLNHQQVPGVELSAGSLGHGLGVAVGMALGQRLQGIDARTWCLLSDGECYEGSTWEAVLSASGFRLGNLFAIVDRNGLTMDGHTEDEMPLDSLEAKFEAFGWKTRVFDGHDFDAICDAFDAGVEDARDRPWAFIANTVKGKGVPLMEDQAKWHYGGIDTATYNEAVDAVSEYYGSLGLKPEARSLRDIGRSLFGRGWP